MLEGKSISITEELYLWNIMLVVEYIVIIIQFQPSVPEVFDEVLEEEDVADDGEEHADVFVFVL